MRRTALIALAAVLASSTACTMTRGTSGTLIAAGAVTTILGAVVMQPTPVDADRDGVNEFLLDDDYSDFVPGAVLLMGGLAMVVAGITARRPPDREVPTVAVGGAPMSVAGPGGPAITPPRAPLPEIATSATLLRMAQQVRAAASRGNCDAAWTTLTEIVERDHAYGEALATGPVLAPCRPTL